MVLRTHALDVQIDALETGWNARCADGKARIACRADRKAHCLALGKARCLAHGTEGTDGEATRARHAGGVTGARV